MKIRYDPKVDALYIRLREGKIDDSDEVSEGVVMDYDDSGVLMGIEILDASRVLGGREMKVELSLSEGAVTER
jgi:uncharacterized protein YuzE